MTNEARRGNHRVLRRFDIWSLAILSRFVIALHHFSNANLVSGQHELRLPTGLAPGFGVNSATL
jgi:hypothetical protein